MYYDNKSTFYIKQYGPAVFVIIISLVLVLSGLYVYLSSNKNNKPQDTLVAKNNTDQQIVENKTINENEDQITDSLKQSEEENSLESTTDKLKAEKEIVNLNEIKLTTVLTSEIRKLSKLEKLNNVTVLGMNDNKDLIVTISDNNYKVELIGIDYKKSPSNIKDTINNDLVNKKVTLSFDNVKVEDTKLCAYLYVDDSLYNQSLLKNGLATLKVEKANTSLLNDLVSAQKYAKENSIGIWKK